MKQTASARPGAGSRVARIIALAAGAFYLAVGLWAFLAPDSFYVVVAPFPPYGRHLLHDVGAFQVGLGLVLVLGAGTRAALQPALLAVLVATALHTISHVEDKALGGHATDPLGLGLLCALLATALVLERRVTARTRLASSSLSET